ncbi:hypothetical protein GCM10019016_109930 [Streptomyces prasinosporus]|uniref:NAD-dependent epimerase/dehydratase family protein n=1 Tax=Streptomyces prasinosporus TaxID=68256 RepID=A0ABP6UBM8_9ACTN
MRVVTGSLAPARATSARAARTWDPGRRSVGEHPWCGALAAGGACFVPASTSEVYGDPLDGVPAPAGSRETGRWAPAARAARRSPCRSRPAASPASPVPPPGSGSRTAPWAVPPGAVPTPGRTGGARAGGPGPAGAKGWNAPLAGSRG